MHILYYLALQLYGGAIRLLAYWKPSSKAGRWWRGRKAQRLPQNPKGEPLIWMHVASLGEFEQGRPLLERFRKEQPQHRLVLSFFSPSGYERRKDYEGVDEVFYLPLDGPRNARRCLDALQPQLVIFVKYEFWHYYLKALEQRNIPCFLVSAHFRPSQLFFQWYGGFFGKILTRFSHLFVQTEADVQLLQSIGIRQCSRAGDTRLDRVLQIRAQHTALPLIAAFAEKRRLLVVGSSWPADEQAILALLPQLPPQVVVLLAPHEIKETQLQAFEEACPLPCLRYSQAKGQDLSAARVLLLDNVGMLSKSYAYADWAYVGGGFGAGIHNVLEAAVFEIPVFTGPKYQKFVEARLLQEAGAHIEVPQPEALPRCFAPLLEKAPYEKACHAAAQYVQQQVGATERIFQFWQKNSIFQEQSPRNNSFNL